MRVDKFMTLGVIKPLLRVHRMLREDNRIPLLMYHSISGAPNANRRGYYELTTSPQLFSEQMSWLKENGWTGASIEKVFNHTLSKETGQRIVAITFDDGFRDFHAAAWPIMQCHGFTATVYLPTQYISEGRETFKGRECMTWREVRELRKQGVHFGSHTATHPELYKMKWKAIERELVQSKQKLEKELGETVTSFAYPYAFPQEDARFTHELMLLLRAIGYKNCATTAIGRPSADASDYFLKRLPVSSSDDLRFLNAKLNGAYDWMGSAQSVYRKLKQKRRTSE